MSTSLEQDYLTVAEAATLFKVSQSTVWRWIDQDAIPAYRIGRRGIRLRRADLTRLIAPARKKQEKGGGMTEIEKERERLSRPLTKEEQREALAALEAAEHFSTELRKRHGDRLFSDSAEIVRQMREERSRQLQ